MPTPSAGAYVGRSSCPEAESSTRRHRRELELICQALNDDGTSDRSRASRSALLSAPFGSACSRAVPPPIEVLSGSSDRHERCAALRSALHAQAGSRQAAPTLAGPPQRLFPALSSHSRDLSWSIRLRLFAGSPVFQAPRASARSTSKAPDGCSRPVLCHSVSPSSDLAFVQTHPPTVQTQTREHARAAHARPTRTRTRLSRMAKRRGATRLSVPIADLATRTRLCLCCRHHHHHIRRLRSQRAAGGSTSDLRNDGGGHAE